MQPAVTQRFDHVEVYASAEGEMMMRVGSIESDRIGLGEPPPIAGRRCA